MLRDTAERTRHKEPSLTGSWRSFGTTPLKDPSGIRVARIESLERYSRVVPEPNISALDQKLQKLGFNGLKELVNVPVVSRTSGVPSLTAIYTMRGQSLDHTRLSHSIDVAIRLTDIVSGPDARSIPKEIKIAIILAGVLHDPHPAFSHTGENILRSFPHTANFDHEKHGLKLIQSNPELKNALGSYADTIYEILRKPGESKYPGLSKLVRDVDRISCLAYDLLAPVSSFEDQQQLLRVADACTHSIKFGRGSDPYVTKVQPFIDLLALRQRDLLTNGLAGPTLVADEVIGLAVHDAVRKEQIRPEHLVSCTNREIIGCMQGKYQEILTLGGTDSYFSPLVALPMSNLTDLGRRFITGSASDKMPTEKLAAVSWRGDVSILEVALHRAIQKQLPADCILVAVQTRSVLDKKISLETAEVGSSMRQTVNIECKGAPEHRALILAVQSVPTRDDTFQPLSDNSLEKLRRSAAYFLRSKGLGIQKREPLTRMIQLFNGEDVPLSSEGGAPAILSAALSAAS